MTNCTKKSFQFPALKNRKVIANFNGGSVTSDAGGLLLREADRQLDLLSTIAKVFPDARDQSKVQHSILTMLRQRVFGIALGYEDLNDHDTLRKDIALQTMVNTDTDLASSPTLCRFEHTAARKIAIDIHKKIIDNFIASHKNPPKEIILDFDATDDLIHGLQEGRYFHGYYGDYCFLPLYVFCGKQLLVSYLRTSKKDAAHHFWAILSLLVKRFRQSWPDVKIILRADSGFCRHQALTWCEKNNVYYIVGIARNKRLEKLLQPHIQQAKKLFEDTETKQRLFAELNYSADSWTRERKIIGKAEYTDKGSNPRFIVTNLFGKPQDLYDNGYCARGDMENRIKEVQLNLFSDRTSCHDWWANQLRMLLSSLAYIYIEHIRRTMLIGTELENSQVNTIRLRLFKIGAVVVRNTRSVRFSLSSYFPLQKLFSDVYAKLAPT